LASKQGTNPDCHSSLVAPTQGARAYRALDAAGLCEAYVKRQRNDAADAEAICEAVTRANMRFVETKTPRTAELPMLHRTRQIFICQQTSVINAIRAHLAELGVVAPVGRKGVEQLLAVAAAASDHRVPEAS
jgi:transposase